MEVITIQSDAFNNIIDKLDSLEKKVETFYQKNASPLEDKWLDNQDVCQLLHISKRTLQQYRTNKVLPFSQVGSKIYYKASDINEYLRKHYSEAINQ
jgi:excisionase family DNA binding protein